MTRKRNKTLLIIGFLFFHFSLFSQNTNKSDSLKIELQKTKSEVKRIEKKIKVIEKQITELRGWKVGTFGTIGANLSNFNNWYSNKKPNLSSGYINISQNAYAKIMRKKYFWVNHATLNLSWKKII